MTSPRCPYHEDCPTNQWDRDFTADIEAEGFRMDPQVHDAPLYVQTFAWVVAIALGVLMIAAIAWSVGEVVDTVAECRGALEH